MFARTKPKHLSPRITRITRIRQNTIICEKQPQLIFLIRVIRVIRGERVFCLSSRPLNSGSAPNFFVVLAVGLG